MSYCTLDLSHFDLPRALPMSLVSAAFLSNLHKYNYVLGGGRRISCCSWQPQRPEVQDRRKQHASRSFPMLLEIPGHLLLRDAYEISGSCGKLSFCSQELPTTVTQSHP